MPWQITTCRAVRDDAIETIKAIVPRERPLDTFKHVRHPGDTAGGALRLFHVSMAPPEPDEDDVFSDGLTFTIPIRVFVNYGNLEPLEADVLVAEDAAQMYMALLRRTSPTVQGAGVARFRGWEYISDRDGEDGITHGYFAFWLRALLADTVA